VSHITELQDAINKLHKARATHVESVPMREAHQGRTVWEGVVEVFRLRGHPMTNRIYGWVHDTDDPKHPKQYVTVLHVPPVVSPQTAVQAVILQEYKSRAKSN
jgi:hypothetical protein